MNGHENKKKIPHSNHRSWPPWGKNGERLEREKNGDNVITPTLNTPTVITPTLNTSTVTDSLCNSGAFNNPNAVRDCPFNLKEEAWFLSWSRKFFRMQRYCF
jgi:hypothetical protein